MTALLSHSRAALAEPAYPYGFDIIAQQAMLELDRIAARRGVQLTIETDPTEFAAISLSNERTQSKLMPVLDFRVHRFDANNFLWLKGEDADGQVVTTAAIRLLDMEGMNLKEFGECLRLFYGDPEQHAAAGETYSDDCISAQSIGGTVTFSGGIWIEPRFRGPGEDGIRLSQVLGRFVRLLGRSHWDPDFYVSAIQNLLKTKGVAAAYGWPHIEPGIIWSRGVAGEATAIYGHLGWMSRSELDEDIAMVAEGGLKPAAMNSAARSQSFVAAG